MFNVSDGCAVDLPSLPRLTHVSQHPEPVSDDGEDDDCLSEATLSALLNPDTRCLLDLYRCMPLLAVCYSVYMHLCNHLRVCM